MLKKLQIAFSILIGIGIVVFFFAMVTNVNVPTLPTWLSPVAWGSFGTMVICSLGVVVTLALERDGPKPARKPKKEKKAKKEEHESEPAAVVTGEHDSPAFDEAASHELHEHEAGHEHEAEHEHHEHAVDEHAAHEAHGEVAFNEAEASESFDLDTPIEHPTETADADQTIDFFSEADTAHDPHGHSEHGHGQAGHGEGGGLDELDFEDFK